MPAQVLDDPALLRLILPALRADAALYRNYVYAEEPPLDCPIRAYGGTEDPNVRREHLDAWARTDHRNVPSAHVSRRPLFSCRPRENIYRSPDARSIGRVILYKFAGPSQCTGPVPLPSE